MPPVLSEEVLAGIRRSAEAAPAADRLIEDLWLVIHGPQARPAAVAGEDAA